MTSFYFKLKHCIDSTACNDAFMLLDMYAQKSKSLKLHLKCLDLILLHADPVFTHDHAMFSLDILMHHEGSPYRRCAILEGMLLTQSICMLKRIKVFVSRS